MKRQKTKSPTSWLVRTTLFILLSLVCYSLWPVNSCLASSSEITISLTQEQSTMLLNLLKEQEPQLAEALNSIEQAQMELDESNNELMQAQQELAEQKKELMSLRKILAEQQSELSSASKSIANASAYLEQAKKDMIDLDKKHKAKERKLKWQRTLWEIVSCVIAGVAIGR